jgi:hypothetical protein
MGCVIAEEKVWTKIESVGIPSGRQYHSAVMYDGYMYVFAGNSNGYYSDLHRLHVGMHYAGVFVLLQC